ncbi:MAG TPA: DUF3455 domain-containing protein [Kofleriaceae bacterium]|nr:DUF3455 domain-containing protein [Kofleriaceae bacterium]
MRRVLAVLFMAACAHAPATSTTTSEPTTVMPPRPRVAPELAVPDDAALALVGAAKGVQVYECGPDGWKLRAPRAELFDGQGARIASHFGGIDKDLPAGPYWEASDGSRVHGGKPVSVANAGSIPLLKLEALDTSGTGVLAKIGFIQRLATTGGVAPAGPCAAGQTAEVAYTATYYFYARP